jgi:hypothetical protein
MKDDVFVKLDNMRDAFADQEGETNEDYEDYLRASEPIISEDLGDGVTRLVHSVVLIYVQIDLLGIPSRMRSTSSFHAGNIPSS